MAIARNFGSAHGCSVRCEIVPILTIAPVLMVLSIFDWIDIRRSFKFMSRTNSPKSSCRRIFADFRVAFAITGLIVVAFAGCHVRRDVTVPQANPCQKFLQEIEYPDLCDDSCTNGNDLVSGPPITISNFHDMEPWDMSLDECVLQALSGSKVIQRLGGIVVNSPQAATTLLDPALIESNPLQSVEAALSAFDADVATSFFFNRNERSFNNVFFGAGAATLTTNASTFQTCLLYTSPSPRDRTRSRMPSSA